MSIALEVVRDKPLGYWPLDDTTPFDDYSGYNRAASGGSGRHASLANGLGDAAVFNDANRGQFAFPTFVPGKEHRSFSLEAIVRPMVGTAEVQILGNLNQMDGLTINGTIISFVTKYTSAGEARASFNLEIRRSVHVVGVHTPVKNSLYVDGELVAEVELTDAQKVASYPGGNGTLYSGASAVSTNIAMASVAVYNHALNPESAERHALEAKTAEDIDVVAEAFGGQRIPLVVEEPGNIFLSQSIDEDHEWEDGLMIDVGADDGDLIPSMSENVSLTGYWVGLFPISVAETNSIYGVKFDWDGIGATVEASLDETTWVPVERNKFVSNIPVGFDPTDKELYIRISFPGGIEGDESYIANFTGTGYLTATSTPSDRNITHIGQVRIGRDEDTLDYSDDWGLKYDETSATIVGAPTDGVAVKTIEVWARHFRPDSDIAVARYILDTRSAAATGNPYFYANSGVLTWDSNATNVYINGALSAKTGISLPIGQWFLLHLTYTTGLTTDIHLAQRYTNTSRSNSEIGSLAVYDTVLTAAQIAAIYAQHTGTEKFRVGDNSVIGVSESPAAAVIYEHAWSIQPAG